MHTWCHSPLLWKPPQGRGEVLYVHRFCLPGMRNPGLGWPAGGTM